MSRGTKTGCSMGGSIINTRLERYKNSKKYKNSLKKIKKCSQCVNFSKGYCKNFNMRPSTLELAGRCKSFEVKAQKKEK